VIRFYATFKSSPHHPSNRPLQQHDLLTDLGSKPCHLPNFYPPHLENVNDIIPVIYSYTDSIFNYTYGDWQTVDLPAARHGGLTYTQTPQGQVDLRFFGTGIEILYSKGPGGCYL
jgi:hypothetical protein